MAWWLTAAFQCFAAVLVAALLAHKYVTYHYDKWRKLGVPYIEPEPLFGNFRDVFMGRVSLTNLIHAYYGRFGDARFYGMYEARSPTLVVRNPALAHAILISDFGSFHDRRADKVSFEHDKLFDHLVHLRGALWKAVRSKLSPTFSTAKLKSMLGDINVCTGRLINNLEAQITNNNGTRPFISRYDTIRSFRIFL